MRFNQWIKSLTQNARKQSKLKHTFDNKTKGNNTEQLACDYLQTQGLQLVQRNFSSYYGEIDLIMRDANTIVFIEVRYRKNRKFGGAAASVTKTKQQRIIKTALYYQQRHATQDTMRFDVIAVEGEDAKIKWIKNAFSSF